MPDNADDDRVSTHWHNCYRGHLGCANVEIERLRKALRRAREDMEGWASYADDYFKKKHDLAADLAAIDAALNDGMVTP